MLTYVCQMSSRFKSWRPDIPLVNHQDSPLTSSINSEHPDDESKSKTGSHTSNEVLTLAAQSAPMSKQSFVAAHRVFEVSLKMLRPFGKASDINLYRLDERSLGVLRTWTATAIDQHRREHYFSSDAIPSLDSDFEADDEPWLIDFSDSEEEMLDVSPSKPSQHQAVDAIEDAIEYWARLGEPDDEVISHLKLAQQKALAYSSRSSSRKVASGAQRFA